MYLKNCTFVKKKKAKQDTVKSFELLVQPESMGNAKSSSVTHGIHTHTFYPEALPTFQ